MEGLSLRNTGIQLAGILARGSQRSQACCRYYGVPLYTRFQDLPSDIDAACVVVRGSLLGGAGSELARSLMQRGIHVVQEHPLHHDELAECLRVARACRVQYQLNMFYSNLPAVDRFVRTTRELLKNRRPVYVDAAASFQVVHALFDILRRLLGRVRPWGFCATQVSATVRSLSGGEMPFRSLDGVLGGIPVSIRIQNQIDVSDPDGGSYLFHRITLGTEAGELTLATTHGPVIWNARPDVPREVRDADSRCLFVQSPGSPGNTCTAVLASPDVGSQRSTFVRHWPEAALRAVLDLRRAIFNGDDPLRLGQSQLAICRVWQDLTTELGPPQLTRRNVLPSPLSNKEFDALQAAAGKCSQEIVELPADSLERLGQAGHREENNGRGVNTTIA